MALLPVTGGAAARSQISRLPIAWTLVCLSVLSLAFLTISWPFIDVHNLFREAETWSWRQYVRFAFTRGIEYRPLLTLGVKAAYELVGLRLWFYQGLVLVQFGLVLALLVWILRPTGVRRGAAACVALGCVVGLHTSRILFGFVPLNVYSGALVFILLALALALDPRTRAFDWIFLPLTFTALLLLESGLLIAPLLALLWWLEAPGVSLRGLAATATGVAAYIAIRLTFGTMGEAVIHTGSGLGFSQLAPEDLRNIFERAPWLFWLYNLCASFLTVVASEPRAGVYRFVASLLRGETLPWQWIHLGSSLVTTILIAVALLVRRPRLERDRLLLAGGLVLLFCGTALGVLYTRDRIGLFAGVGYALLVYVALAAWLERPASGWRRAVVACGVGLAAAAWTWRTAETYFQLRDTAWDYHLEWTDRYADLGGTRQPQTALLTSLRSAALGATPDDPRLDPAWTHALFERRFSPLGGPSSVPPDSAADNAVRPLSPPFDIRWKSDVDADARLRLEGELGLADARPVERDPSGRTWTYRLRQPTRDRVRTVLMNTAVEDTARVDPARFEILQ